MPLIRIEIDVNSARSRLQLVETTLKFIATIDQKQFPSHANKEYYDVIRELLLAHLAKKGWQCTNQLLLPLYAEEHFQKFKENAKTIKELFILKQHIHEIKQEQISSFLKKNEVILQQSIAQFKEKLHEE